MIRNLGKMSAIGLIKQNSDAAIKVVHALNNKEVIRKARIHPMNVLTAKLTYENGKGIRGSLTWNVNQNITSALEDAFYLSFGNVEPTGKRTIIGVDVSGSMIWGERTWGSNNDGLMGIPGLSPRVAAAALCMVTFRTEKVSCACHGFTDRFIDLKINQKDSLKTVMDQVYRANFGRTDCALPMVWAKDNKVKADTFIIYTDNDTWAGRKHPRQALKEYRQKMGIDSKLIVCAMTATNYSIADPKNPKMLDIAGFDSATPRLISEFAKD
jgi:60 kDa SS-A/Ro ribonucleoprotein